jgi:DNA-binding CsgD family transcriptional regulator
MDRSRDEVRRLATEVTTGELRRFVTAAFAMLRAVVNCDFVSVLYRSGGNGLLREVDSRGRTYSRAFMKRYSELTPAIRLVQQNRGIKVLPTRTGLTLREEDLRRTEFYRKVMKVQGWRHAVALCFWGEPLAEFPVLVLTVNRSEGRSDFSNADIRRLSGLHSILDGWVADLLEHTATKAAQTGVSAAVRHEARGLIVLDWRLRVTLANSAARKFCAQWGYSGTGEQGPASLRAGVPPALLAACRDLYDDWRTTIRVGKPRARGPHRHRNVVDPEIGGMSARISIKYPESDGLAEPCFVIELRQVPFHEADVPRTHVTSMLAKLTPAEREVAAALGAGLSNQEIADRLGRSIHSVKFLLHRIYQRTSIANRTQLASAVQRLAWRHAPSRGGERSR